MPRSSRALALRGRAAADGVGASDAAGRAALRGRKYDGAGRCGGELLEDAAKVAVAAVAPIAPTSHVPASMPSSHSHFAINTRLFRRAMLRRSAASVVVRTRSRLTTFVVRTLSEAAPMACRVLTAAS